MGIPGMDGPTPAEMDEAIAWADATSRAIAPLREHYMYNVDVGPRGLDLGPRERFNLHDMMMECRVWAAKEYARDSKSATLAVFLEHLDRAAESKNGYLENAVAVSFIEMLWDSRMILHLGPAATDIARHMYPQIFRRGRPLKPSS